MILIPVLTAIMALSVACESRQEPSADKAPAIAGIKVEPVTLTPVDDYYEATGTIRSKTSSEISSRVMGSIIALHVREGDRVRRGQTLIEIDNRDAMTQISKARAGLIEAQDALEEIERSARAAESAVAAAEANKRLAEATYNRYKTLAERRSVSRQEFDEAQAKHEVARAERERADRLLQMVAARKQQALARIDQARADIAGAQLLAGYARITSPINGIVTARQTDIGQIAAPGAPLLTIEDDACYRLEASVEESQIKLTKIGDPVFVSIQALGDTELAGSVAEIVPAADVASRSFTLKIDLPVEGDKSGLRSGMFGRARFSRGQKPSITLPLSAVSVRGQLTSVYVVDGGGIARLRLIKTGKAYGDRVEVLSGLNEGEQIITSGAEQVSDGSRAR